jgi:hypothetical protein
MGSGIQICEELQTVTDTVEKGCAKLSGRVFRKAQILDTLFPDL